MNNTQNKLSTTYQQLSKLFEILENANFKEQKDFGENIANSFTWFLSPPAVTFLKKRYEAELVSFQANPRLAWKITPWQGYRDVGVDISLVF